ncbi:MAG: hypothetical protein ABFC94_19250 [Syntrophomonas sp.]
MAEKTKADIYIAYLDKILAGEKDIEPIEDEEIAKLILLAKTMLANNLSINSKTREKLRKRLLDQVIKESNFSVRSKNDDELDDDTLDYVAAGFERQAGEQKNICPYCGSGAHILGEKCPICHH